MGLGHALQQDRRAVRGYGALAGQTPGRDSPSGSQYLDVSQAWNFLTFPEASGQTFGANVCRNRLCNALGKILWGVEREAQHIHEKLTKREFRNGSET
ncbi:hypothetical protein NCCP1664_29090 [Zafaria cholistanensis]|uniref:Uncharacterized protein n=1 Tax=Zafaria cholistanensis TaxID=1682741 RepID=A0A5A7NU62_9MICC|nr:hypothetical protein NCCP1664_29090 [Zafaria cholistanensis]